MLLRITGDIRVLKSDKRPVIFLDGFERIGCAKIKQYGKAGGGVVDGGSEVAAESSGEAS